MSYVDFKLGSATRGTAGAAKTLEERLGQLEREAVLLARTDGLRSVGRARPALDLARRLFLLRVPNRLANPRLEALRSFAVITAHSRTGEADDAELVALGFSGSQVAEARGMALRFRRPPRAPSHVIQLVIAAVASWMTYLLILPALGDFLVAVIVSACANLTWLSMTKPRSRRA